MKVASRHDKLVGIVRKGGKVSVEDLALHLGASRETIRRDLTHLAKQGRVLKVHGGATMPLFLGEEQFQHRLSQQVGAKLTIAKTAAAMFKPGETLFIDTGTTTLIFAEELAKTGGLTIVTNSTEIARTIAKVKNGNRVFLLGGEFGADNSQTIGTMAAAQTRSFRAHHAVLTVGAIDLRTGAMDFNIEEAQIARAMIEQSQEVTILADQTKFNALASFEVCPLSGIDRLVCETAPPTDIRNKLADLGQQVILTPTNTKS